MPLRREMSLKNLLENKKTSKIIKVLILSAVFILVYAISYMQFLKVKAYVEESSQNAIEEIHEAAEKTEKPAETSEITDETAEIEITPEELIEEKPATEETEPLETIENIQPAEEQTPAETPDEEQTLSETPSPDACQEEKKTKFLPTAELAKKLENALDKLIEASEKENSDDQKLDELQKHTESLTEAVIKLAQMAETKIKALEKQMNPETEIPPFSACRSLNIYTFSPTTRQCVISSYEKCFGEEFENLEGFFDLDTCQRYYSLTSKMTTKEQKAFDEQKAVYITKLLELQEAYDYFSYNWNALVDLATQAGTYEMLSEAKDTISNFRLEQGKEKF